MTTKIGSPPLVADSSCLMSTATRSSSSTAREQLRTRLSANDNTLNRFPWPQGTPPGTVDEAGHILNTWGAWFDDESGEGSRFACKVFTTVHFSPRTDTERAREAQAASFFSSAACGNVECDHRRTGKFVKLEMCSRCRLIGYCGVACQTVHWQEHKVLCKSLRVPKSSDTSIPVNLSLAAFHRAATALCVGASGPIALLNWIWRQNSGYAGDIPFLEESIGEKLTHPFPPIVLIELEENMQPPIAMRISQVNIYDVKDPTFEWLNTSLNFTNILVTTLRDATVVGRALRSGERVFCVVTTTARDPRRTKIMSLTHAVPMPFLAKKFREIKQVAEKELGESGAKDRSTKNLEKRYTAPHLLEATHIIARGMTTEEIDVFINGHVHEDDRKRHLESNEKTAQAFCNCQYAVSNESGSENEANCTLSYVHAIIISGIEMVVRK